VADPYGVTSLSEKRKNPSPSAIQGRSRNRFDDLESEEAKAKKPDLGATSGDPDTPDALTRGAADLNRDAKKKRRRGFYTENESELNQMEDLK